MIGLFFLLIHASILHTPHHGILNDELGPDLTVTPMVKTWSL